MDYSFYAPMPPPKFKSPFKRNKADKAYTKSLTSSPSKSSFLSSPTKSAYSSASKSVLGASTLAKSRPVMPPNDEFFSFLESSVNGLKEDFTSGARQMADNALGYLATLIDLAAGSARDREELWKMVVAGAKELSKARPSMSAAITSALLRALSSIEQMWDAQTDQPNKSVGDLSRIAGYHVDRLIKERKDTGVQLGKNFTVWIKRHIAENLPRAEQNHIRILTLSNSSTIRAALLSLLENAPTLHIALTILESRPRCEGADMASQILSSAKDMIATTRITLTIAPDCAIGTLIRGIDVVLLGADCISASGDVSNKIGSLASAVCAKTLSPSTRVVVVSDGDKIAAPGIGHAEVEKHPSSEMTGAWKDETKIGLGFEQDEDKAKDGTGRVEVFGEWFEWVPKEYVDVYVTETGILDREVVGRMAAAISELEGKLFGLV